MGCCKQADLIKDFKKKVYQNVSEREKGGGLLMCSRFRFSHCTNKKSSLVHIGFPSAEVDAELSMPGGVIRHTVWNLRQNSCSLLTA